MDEKGHLDWVGKRLERYEREGMTGLDDLRKRYREIDERLYRSVVIHEQRLWDFLGAAP